MYSTMFSVNLETNPNEATYVVRFCFVIITDSVIFHSLVWERMPNCSRTMVRASGSAASR